MPDNYAGLLQPTPAALDTSSLPQAKAARLPRHQGLWAAVTLEELTNRRRDGTFSARTRLLLYLRIKSRRGQKPVVLTNTMAEEIGLDRRQKRICLNYLEACGDVAVERQGKRSPVVSVHHYLPEEPLG
jgi:hypothetical protein